MAQQPYYAVKKGRKPGIYRTEGEYVQQTVYFPGATGKKFKTEEAAYAYLGISYPRFRIETQISEQVLQSYFQNESCILMYVDGSFSIEEKRIAYAFSVIGEQYQRTYEYGGTRICDDKKNGAFLAEAAATMRSMKHAILQKKRHIVLFHDNLKIRDILQRDKKKIKTDLEMDYYKFVQSMTEKYELTITFIKVKSHDKDIQNRYVDKLAKKVRAIPVPF